MKLWEFWKIQHRKMKKKPLPINPLLSGNHF